MAPSSHRPLWATCALALGFTFGLSHCGGLGTRSDRGTTPVGAIIPTGKAATVKSDSNGKVVAALDPNATETQVISASASSNIRDVSVAFRPGSLAVPVDVSLQEGATVSHDALVSDLQIGAGFSVTSSARPVMVSASAPVDLAKPMVIAIPLPAPALRLADGDDLSRLALVYRVRVQATGDNLTGVIPGKQLTIAQGKVLHETKYFGWFQLTYFNQPVPPKEVKSALPLNMALETVARLLDLPACGAADVGRVVYALEEKTFKHCTASGWADIDLRGPAGPAGPAGTAGTPGANGNGLRVFTEGGALVGDFLYAENDYFGVLMSDGNVKAIAEFSRSASSFRGTRCDSMVDFSCSCFYVSGNCSGTCYVAKPLLYGVYEGVSGAKFRYGSFAAATGSVMQSYWDPGNQYCYSTFASPSQWNPLTPYTPTNFPTAGSRLYLDK